MSTLIHEGNTSSALTDVRDIGRYIARIIVDPRTINKYILAYSELWTPNDVYALLEQLSNETIPRTYISEQQLREQISKAEEAIEKNPSSLKAGLMKVSAEYQISWGVRGDNTPEYAKFLGYLDSKELYPDLEFRSFRSFLEEVLKGGAHTVYQNNELLKKIMAEN